MKTIFALVGLAIVARFAWILIEKLKPELFAENSFQVGYWVCVIIGGFLVLGKD